VAVVLLHVAVVLLHVAVVLLYVVVMLLYVVVTPKEPICCEPTVNITIWRF